MSTKENRSSQATYLIRPLADNPSMTIAGSRWDDSASHSCLVGRSRNFFPSIADSKADCLCTCHPSRLELNLIQDLL